MLYIKRPFIHFNEMLFILSEILFILCYCWFSLSCHLFTLGYHLFALCYRLFSFRYRLFALICCLFVVFMKLNITPLLYVMLAWSAWTSPPAMAGYTTLARTPAKLRLLSWLYWIQHEFIQLCRNVLYS